MEDVTGLQRYHAITFFNEQMYGTSKAYNRNSVLGGIAYNEAANQSYDVYLSDAINTMFITDWAERYGLNLSETMELEYATFISMKQRLLEYKNAETRALAEQKALALQQEHNRPKR